MSESQAIHPLPLGTQVTVSDGTPRPPERFKRKLRDWLHNNYAGVVVEHSSGQRYTVQRKPQTGWNPNHYIEFLSSGVPAHKVTPTPGACVAPLSDGLTPTVDVAGLLRLEAQAA